MSGAGLHDERPVDVTLKITIANSGLSDYTGAGCDCWTMAWPG
jgi:hypothetical protein